MDEDPFYQVKQEVESSLAHISSLSSSYQRSKSSPSDQEQRSYLEAELRAHLEAIEPDFIELRESVEAIEQVGIAQRLGIERSEVKRRREFVERVKVEIDTIRKTLPRSRNSRSPSPEMYRNRYHNNPLSQSTSSYSSNTSRSIPPSTAATTASSSIGGKRRENENPLEDDAGEEGDPNAEFEMQHQSLLMEQQDRTLTDISGTVGMLRQQARVIGQEVFDQTNMLEELDHQVDSTSSRLAKAQRRMDRFMKDNASSPSSWAILGLIIILSILLFIIVFL